MNEKNPARQSSSLGSTEGASISEVETRHSATPIDAREHDTEKGSNNNACEVSEAVDFTEPERVDWAGPDDAEKPVNWPRAKKWRITLTVSMLTFLTFVPIHREHSPVTDMTGRSHRPCLPLQSAKS
jgi:hypothetical protein